MPAIVNEYGIREVLNLDLSKSELEQLQHSAIVLKEITDQILPTIK